MSNTEDFDAETEELDTELDAPEAPPARKGKPAQAAAKKSGGGGFFKFLVLLVILGAGGAAGGEYLGLIKLPFDIPGVTPPAVVAENAPSEMPGVPLKTAAAGGELVPATGSDAIPPGLEGSAKGPAMMPPPLGAAPASGAPPEDSGKLSIQPPSMSPPPDPLADLEAPPAPAEDMMPAPAAADPLAVAAPPEADPLATPGGPDMLAAPVVPVETSPVAAAPDKSEAPVAAAGPDPESLEKIKQLEEKVAALEKDLAAAEQKAADGKAALEKAEGRAQAAEAAAAKKHRQAAPAATAAGEEPVARPRTARQRKPRSDAAAPVAAAPSAAVSRWVLKSAKPGVAWVAQPGSNELKTISVGDTLTGVGKVTAIAKDEAGRWVVNGTRGRINQ